jgi:hypothetical protein
VGGVRTTVTVRASSSPSASAATRLAGPPTVGFFAPSFAQGVRKSENHLAEVARVRSLPTLAGSVDLELLRARLGRLEELAWRERLTTVVDSALDCLSKAQAVDAGALERLADKRSARDLWSASEGAVATLWLALEEVQQGLRPLCEAQGARAAEPCNALLDLGALDAAAPENGELATVSAPGPSSADPRARVEETAWAMSFVLRGELEGFRRRLPALLKLPNAWELVGALQDHLAHVFSSLNAVVTGIFSSLPGGATEAAAHVDLELELVASRELRQRTFALRDAVLGLEGTLKTEPPGEWQEALTSLYKLVDEFMFSAAFGWMRAGDKHLFLCHQRTLSEILALWSPLRAEPARRAVGNLARYLEALEVINNRECLRTHDKSALNAAASKLREAMVEKNKAGGRFALGKALAALAEAQGRDRELDALVAQTLDPATPVPLEALLARTEEVLSRMGS